MAPPRGRKLPSYVEYLIRRAGALYMMTTRLNLNLARSTPHNVTDGVVSLLAAHHIAVQAAGITRALIVELRRTLSSVEIVESYHASGYLDTTATTRNLALMRPPVWRGVRRGPTTPYRSCICSLLHRILEALTKLESAWNNADSQLSKLYGINPSSTTPLRRLRRAATRAKASIARIAARECGPVTHYTTTSCSMLPRPLRGRLGLLTKTLAEVAALLEKAVKQGKTSIEITSRSLPANATTQRIALRMTLERLYELYTLYLALRALSELGPMRGENSTILVEFGDGIRVYYNSRPEANGKPLSRVALGYSRDLDSADLRRISGIPDITIVINNKVKIVIEVKHSRNMAYLTLARFKTIAYIHEYDADAGILVYPGITMPGEVEHLYALDEEYAATASLLKKADEKGYISIKIKDNATLYLMPVKPVEELEDDNVKRLQDTIFKIIENNI